MKFDSYLTGLAVAMSWCAFAAAPVGVTLPEVVTLDTEVSTNVPFASWEAHFRELSVRLDFAARTNNNVEAWFGTDANGDGVLQDSETDLVLGWDVGEWFVRDNATGERFATASVRGAEDPIAPFVFRLKARRSLRIFEVVFADSGRPVFPELSRTMPSWLYDPSWNIVRVVGRGDDIRAAGESFVVQTQPTGLHVLFR